ncbi:MAG: hypothetical protein GEV11_21935 [Streptosporangiales bacterium]|nr:hypothetical protein [Streptosporangiales bacterium]
MLQDQQEYVVEVDQDVVAAARVRTLRLLRISAWTGVVGGGLILVLAGVMAALATGPLGGTGFMLAALMAVPGVILLASERKKFARIRELQATWERYGLPDVAMRMSAQGLRISVDTAPDHVFLPWLAVAGFHVRTWRGQQLLMLGLAPGVTPASPGVIGLDHPDVQRVLSRKVLGVKGLRFAVPTLRRPLPEIDQAAAYFTQGRVRIS